MTCIPPVQKTALVCSLLLSMGLGSGPAFAQGNSAANSYAAFVAALSSISSAAGEVLDHDREQARITLIRQAFTKSVLEAFPVQPQQPQPQPAGEPAPPATPAAARNATFSIQLNEAELLCAVRYKSMRIVENFSERENGEAISIDHPRLVAEKAYLDFAINQLKEKSVRANNDDLFAALRAALSRSEINAPKDILTRAEREALEGYIRTRCHRDLKEYEKAFYGQVIPSRAQPYAAMFNLSEPDDALISQLTLFGPVGSLVSTVFGIIKPAALQFSNIAIDYKNNAAIRAFLSNPIHQKNLKTAGESLAQKESDYLFAKRLALAGEFAENIAAINQTPLDVTSKRIQAACGNGSGLYSRTHADQPSAAFRKCYYVLWKQYEPAIRAALAAASTYDRIADAGDTATQLKKYRELMGNFSAIVNDSTPAATWADVTRMLVFANAIKTAFSKESAQQVQAAIDAVRED